MVESIAQNVQKQIKGKKKSEIFQIDDFKIETGDRVFLIKNNAVITILNQFYTPEERKKIIEAYRIKNEELLDEVIEAKWPTIITEEYYNITETVDPKVGYLIVNFVRLLAPYSIFYSLIVKDKNRALQKLQQLLKKHEFLEREINTQLTYIYLRFSDIINKLEHHLTESFVEQYVATLFDLFYTALLDERYSLAETVGFGAVTSIIQTLLKINISKKAKYNLLYQDINYENIIGNISTIKNALFSQYQKKVLYETLKPYLHHTNANESYLYKNFLFDFFILPLFVQETKIKFYTSINLIPAQWKIAITKYMQAKYSELLEVLSKEKIPHYSFINNKKPEIELDNVIYIFRLNNLFYAVTYKGKTVNYGLRKLQKAFPSLKTILPKLNIYPLYQDQLCILLSCIHISIKDQTNLAKLYKIIEKKYMEIL